MRGSALALTEGHWQKTVGRNRDLLQTWLPVNLPLLLWTMTGITVTALSLRFGMRAVGVRDDIPLPGRIYTLTAPMVEPFYNILPASDRFDYPAVEAASLAAAGVIIALALGIYILSLLFTARRAG